MSHLLQFLKDSSSFEDGCRQLEEKYALNIKNGKGRFDRLFCFNYDQIRSKNKGHPIVREARGIIIHRGDNADDHRVVCWPFTRFFNHGEGHADPVDFDHPATLVFAKEDGSLIKYYYYQEVEEWVAATRQTVAIDNNTGFGNISFSQLWDQVKHKIDHARLNVHHTYMFELVSPQNRIIVSYQETDLFHLGTRDLITGQELHYDLGVQKPRNFSLNDIDDCLELVKTFNPSEAEGLVAVDHQFRRVKIKSPAYVAFHNKRGNGNLLCGADLDLCLLKIILLGEEDEWLAVYPDHEPKMKEINSKFQAFIRHLGQLHDRLPKNLNKSADKEFALAVQAKDFQTPLPSIHFKIRKADKDGVDFDIESYVREHYQVNNQRLRMLLDLI